MAKRISVGTLHEIVRTNPDKRVYLKAGTGIFIPQDWDTIEVTLETWYQNDRQISASVMATETQIVITSPKEKTVRSKKGTRAAG